MTNRTITDQQVGALPIHGGRAELLEEIMSTPVDQVDRAEHQLDDLAPRRGLRALATVAAVAAVAVTVGGLAAWRIPHQTATPDSTSFGHGVKGGTGSHAKHDPRHSSQQAQVRSVPGGAYVALNEPGWTINYVSQAANDMEVSYARDGQQLSVHLYPADNYSTYVTDRQEFGDGTPTILLGQDATRWASSPESHTTIRTPEDGRFLEAWGSGMDGATYQDLVGQLVQTDEHGFADSMPGDVVTPFNRMEAIHHLLLGVETPPGFTASDVRLSGFNDPYQSAAQVAGSVGCAWLDVWSSGSAVDRQAAIDAFDGSRSWPLLQRIASEGGYSSGFWGMAHRLRVGHTDKGQPLSVDGLKSAICY
jgi:hypothetical protein